MRIAAFSGLSMLGALAALTTATLSARAEGPTPPTQESTKPQQFTLKREQMGSVAAADVGRARARKGDCAGALESFDAAIRTSIEPTLRRDRGLCHERLGNAYPAIDDYRAYLAAAPDAPDGDTIRERLVRLEEQVGVGGRSTEISDSSAKNPGGSASASASVTTSGASKDYDSARMDEDDDTGPLRRGKGWVVGPYFGARRWFFASDVSTSKYAETVGIRVAYAWTRTSSWFGEVGYERFNNSTEDAFSVSGLSGQLGYEARLPFSQSNIDNLWIVGLGVGYEHLVVSQNSIAQSPVNTFGAFVGRGRFSYRHNLGPKAALEAGVDLGVASFFVVGSGSGSYTGEILGLNGALLFGL
jgi:hypothetical protein